MIFDLGALWLIVWLIKNTVMDVSYAISGKPNPRYELKKARARAAGQPLPTQARYGTRDWFADLFSDGLRAQTEWRRRKAAEQAARREPDQVPDQAPDAALTGELAETDPAPAVVTRPEHVPTPTQPPEPDPTQEPAPDQEPPPAFEPPRLIVLKGGAAKPHQPTTTVEEKGEPMATVEQVVNGLDQSINYANQLAAVATEHGPAGNEGYINHLVSSQVGGAAVQTAHDMQEAFANAAAAAEAHANELAKQKAIQEGYDANPDAGDKQFMTQGR